MLGRRHHWRLAWQEQVAASADRTSALPAECCWSNRMSVLPRKSPPPEGWREATAIAERRGGLLV